MLLVLRVCKNCLNRIGRWSILTSQLRLKVGCYVVWVHIGLTPVSLFSSTI